VNRETGALKSTARIEACVPTLKELLDRGAKLTLLAHQGSDIEYQNFYTTQPHAKVLSQLIGQDVKFVDDVCGPAARAAIASLSPGEALLLDNVRFCSEEQTLFEMNLKLTHEQQARTEVVKKLAPLHDLYVCDAFAAAHRDQPSLCGFEQVLPSAMGRLFEEEYCVISGLMENPERPAAFVLGGAKVSDAFLMLGTVLKSGAADLVLTGGLVANILLAAKGEKIGRGSMEFIERSGYAEYIEKAKPLLERYREKILLPITLAYVENGERREVNVGTVPEDALVLDIGRDVADDYAKVIQASKPCSSTARWACSRSRKRRRAPGLCGRRWGIPPPTPWSAAATA
jgi:phosphoglycerate kinase